MSVFRYSLELSKDKEKLTAKAQIHDVNASYKDLSQVLKAIKHKTVADARVILEQAISLTRAIPFTHFHKGMGHRSELGGRKGKYPKKECRHALQLLENAVANAAHKGLDETRLYVSHAAAFKGNVFPRYRKFWAGSVTLGYGKRAVWGNYVTCRAELYVEESKQPHAIKKGKTGKQAAAQSAKPHATKSKSAKSGESKSAEKTLPKKSEPKQEEKPEQKPHQKPVQKQEPKPDNTAAQSEVIKEPVAKEPTAVKQEA